jgi:hypothetical protein
MQMDFYFSKSRLSFRIINIVPAVLSVLNDVGLVVPLSLTYL